MTATVPARILVIDDDISTIRWLSSIVQAFGEVFFATNGAKGIEMARDRLPDIILLDAEMPGLDGFAVCRTLKGEPAFKDVPILFVTAHSDEKIEEAALELGAVDFIAKPSSFATVKARVRTHLALKQRTDELRRISMMDGLTGIANRRAFDTTLHDELRRAIRSKTPLSLMMMDVDHFKLFNDHYGHQQGDECLRGVAAALAAVSRRPGELPARYGGEEFAAILPTCDPATALGFAEAVRAAVATLDIPHAASKTCPHVTVSVGVASLPEKRDDHAGAEAIDDLAKSLIEAADGALYEAKRSGRNKVAAASQG